MNPHTPPSSKTITRPIRALLDAVREVWGNPMTLRRVLDAHPELRADIGHVPRTVAASSVIDWPNWAHHAQHVHLWHYTPSGYRAEAIHLPSLGQLAQMREIQSWACDISDVEGLAASKANLGEFDSLDQMALMRSAGLLTPATPQTLEKNLGWNEIRILAPEGRGDYFRLSTWDGRVFLMNSGGSHHFVAARYLARILGIKVPLVGRLKIHCLNPAAIDTLRSQFHAFVTGSEPVAVGAMLLALERVKVSYCTIALPGKLDRLQVLLLPRAAPSNQAAADVFYERGFEDFGVHLNRLVGIGGEQPVAL